MLMSMMLGIQLGLISLSLQKLGLSAHAALLLLLFSFIGSFVQPVSFTLKTQTGPAYRESFLHGLLRGPQILHTGYTIITINIGGGVIPLGFTSYLLLQGQFGAGSSFNMCTDRYHCKLSSKSASNWSRDRMSVLIAPLTAASAVLLLDFEQSALLAYISGTLGVLIGVDLFHLRISNKWERQLSQLMVLEHLTVYSFTGFIAALLA